MAVLVLDGLLSFPQRKEELEAAIYILNYPSLGKAQEVYTVFGDVVR